MPAIGGAVAIAIGVAIRVIDMRLSGGWFCLRRVRRGEELAPDGRTWKELTPLERGWFFGIPAFSAVAVVLLAVGIAAEW